MKTTDMYSQVIQKTTGMVRDRAVQRLAQKHGLHVLDVTWEDTRHMNLIAEDAGVKVIYPEDMPELWDANDPG
ncbi:MAG: hypothetical protein EA424_01055 [Planctomycetaceae bacterium]|nr:MAG: hypothetical protein EA424_01055 [Planctomycetaceae bacterium]